MPLRWLPQWMAFQPPSERLTSYQFYLLRKLHAPRTSQILFGNMGRDETAPRSIPAMSFAELFPESLHATPKPTLEAPKPIVVLPEAPPSPEPDFSEFCLPWTPDIQPSPPLSPVPPPQPIVADLDDLAVPEPSEGGRRSIRDMSEIKQQIERARRKQTRRATTVLNKQTQATLRLQRRLEFVRAHPGSNVGFSMAASCVNNSETRQKLGCTLCQTPYTK
eukprot:Gregarina_sp_Poly_1__4986@NODE_2642_length_1882_cov_17_729477_g1676_i0_p1_GENE_NODE_2642_length_1882_cov_17_729477_g1676_i0NODE_2642_length_1882_cov_17_729477_g1676_i0_p1_ORF_typecomplete_len220_score18_02_NODE_2642_length_1882_cov_17_729477_g1676_i0150809